MKYDEGLTLVEVILSLFILSILVIGFNESTHTFYEAIKIDTIKQETGQIAKNKMEELKSKHLYIDDVKYSVLDKEQEDMNFTEASYDLRVSIKPLDINNEISYVNIQLSNFEGEKLYNLIRYINLKEEKIPNIYEELTIDPMEI